MSEWKPGDVGANVNFGYRGIFVESCPIPEHGRKGGACWHNESGFSDPPDSPRRRLVVIDPEDREQVERLAGGRGRVDVDWLQGRLRESADPKVYREHDGSLSPWPEVAECYGSHRGDHECPQCAWEHEHDWVAWTARRDGGRRPGMPIRCSKCGGRKCDQDGCALRRHTHTHDAGVSA